MKHLNSFTLVGFLVLILCISSFTSSEHSYGLTVSLKEISYGTYHTTGGTVASKESPSGRSTVITNYSLMRKTDTIDAVLGETFGIEYSIVAKTKKDIKIRRVWELPRPMVDSRGNSFKEISKEFEQTPNINTITTYELEEDFEVIPGNWILKFYYQDKLIYQRTFVIIKR